MTNPFPIRSILHLWGIVLHPAIKYLSVAGRPKLEFIIPRLINFVDYTLFSPKSYDTHWLMFSLYCLFALTLFLGAHSVYVLVIWGKKRSRQTRWINRSLQYLYPDDSIDSDFKPETRAEVVFDLAFMNSLRLHDVVAYGLMTAFMGTSFILAASFVFAVRHRNFSIVCLTLGCALVLRLYESPSELRLKSCVNSGFCQYTTPLEENYVLVINYFTALMKQFDL